MNDQKTFFKPEGRNTLGGKALRRYTTGFTYTSFVGKRKIYKNKNKKQKTKHKTQNTKQRFIKTKNKKQNKTKHSLLSYLVLKYCFAYPNLYSESSAC